MKKPNKFDKLQPILSIILAIIGFVLITLSGKMSNYLSLRDDNLTMYIAALGLGILLMVPLLLYVLKKRNGKS
jgi:hypothetical protein